LPRRISICYEPVAIRQHLLYALKIPDTSGTKKHVNAGHLAKCQTIS
jgi:hypothetical protein